MQIRKFISRSCCLLVIAFFPHILMPLIAEADQESVVIAAEHETETDQLIHGQSVPYGSTKVGTNHTGLLFNGQYICNLTYQQGINWLRAKHHKRPKKSDEINT